MAAPLCIAKNRLVLFQANSQCIDLLRAFHRRLFSNSNKQKPPRKQEKGEIDLNEIFHRPNGNQKVNDRSKNRRHALSSAPKKENDRSDQFQDILTTRRDEALRSVLVRTQNPDVTLQKLQTYGSLEYAGFTSPERTYILAQFKEMRHLESLVKGSSSFSVLNQFPMQSRCLCDNPRPIGTRKKAKNSLASQSTQVYPEDRTFHSYQLKGSFDAEVLALHARKCLNEFDLRQRFFVCSLLEDMLKSLLPDVYITPYGSCLNGFGWWDGDLDMMLSFNGISGLHTEKNSATSTVETPFKFLTEVFSTERQMSQRTLSAMAGIIELMPRVTRVIKILNARVPIIRFRHAALDLQCDLSLQALDSIKMTEILYLLSMVDPRVRPLMTTIKQWALHHKLTSSGEQQKPTSLGFLCLLIFYLQSCQPAVLPSLRQLQSASATGSNRFEIEGVHYQLPLSPGSIVPSTNTQSIEDLLYGFFTFYASFNFEKHAISLIEGSTFSKSDKTSPLHMENPLCIGLNICRNVTQVYVEQLQQAMKLSSQTMNEMARTSSSPPIARLSTLFEQPLEESIHLSIDSLFIGEENVTEKQPNKELTDSSDVLDKTNEFEVNTKSKNDVSDLPKTPRADTGKDSIDCEVKFEGKVV